MSIPLEPGTTFPVKLERLEKPVFHARYQSMRGQQKVLEVINLLHDAPETPITELFQRTSEEIGRTLAGWENVRSLETGEELEFLPESVQDALTYNDAREILRKIAYNISMDDEEKKEPES